MLPACRALRGAAARVPRSFGEGFMVASDPQWRSNSVPSAHKKRVKPQKTMRVKPQKTVPLAAMLIEPRQLLVCY